MSSTNKNLQIKWYRTRPCIQYRYCNLWYSYRPTFYLYAWFSVLPTEVPKTNHRNLYRHEPLTAHRKQAWMSSQATVSVSRSPAPVARIRYWQTPRPWSGRWNVFGSHHSLSGIWYSQKVHHRPVFRCEATDSDSLRHLYVQARHRTRGCNAGGLALRSSKLICFLLSIYDPILFLELSFCRFRLMNGLICFFLIGVSRFPVFLFSLVRPALQMGFSNFFGRIYTRVKEFCVLSFSVA